MTRNKPTCDDCGEQTWGGPCIHNDLWAAIAPNWKVAVPSDPGDLFSWAGVPIGQRVEKFLCFECIERRLGRQLKRDDMPDCEWNEDWLESEVQPPSDATAPTGGRLA